MATSLSQDMHVPPRWKSVQALGTDPKVWSHLRPGPLCLREIFAQFERLYLTVLRRRCSEFPTLTILSMKLSSWGWRPRSWGNWVQQNLVIDVRLRNSWRHKNNLICGTRLLSWQVVVLPPPQHLGGIDPLFVLTPIPLRYSQSLISCGFAWVCPKFFHLRMIQQPECPMLAGLGWNSVAIVLLTQKNVFHPLQVGMIRQLEARLRRKMAHQGRVMIDYKVSSVLFNPVAGWMHSTIRDDQLWGSGCGAIAGH